MGVFWVKLGKKEKVFLHLGTYPYPQSDLTFRNGGSNYVLCIVQGKRLGEHHTYYLTLFPISDGTVKYIRVTPKGKKTIDDIGP